MDKVLIVVFLSILAGFTFGVLITRINTKEHICERVYNTVTDYRQCKSRDIKDVYTLINMENMNNGNQK